MDLESVNLDILYRSSRTLKDSVLHAWVRRLEVFLLAGDIRVATEAGRRIDYIQRVLLDGREEPVESSPTMEERVVAYMTPSNDRC